MVLGIGELLNAPVRSLSLGQRMRADLCASLLHDPELLFLDEPTIGLDVVAKERIHEFIRHINHEGQTTVLLTTHDLAAVQKLCQRVVEGATVITRQSIRAAYVFGRGLSASELIHRISERYSIVDLSVSEPDIEATIRNIYEGNLLRS